MTEEREPLPVPKFVIFLILVALVVAGIFSRFALVAVAVIFIGLLCLAARENWMGSRHG